MLLASLAQTLLHRGQARAAAIEASACAGRRMAAGRPAPQGSLGAPPPPPPQPHHSADLLYAVVESSGHQYDGHLESPTRIQGVLQSLAAAGLRGGGAALAARTRELPAERVATLGELDTVHSYVSRLQRESASASAGPIAVADLGDPDGVTFLTGTSFEDARRAAGAALDLVDAVLLEGAARSGAGHGSGDAPACSTSEGSPPADAAAAAAPAAFGLVRPPGHHATADTPLGYCIFNSVALAARYAQRQHGLHRVLIVDFDVHNGNGTCEIFWEDSSVLVIDVHEANCVYPEPDFVPAGANATGAGAGEGCTINVPMPRYAGHAAAVAVFDDIVGPAARRFNPDIILVSAGYDAHVRDPFQLLQYRSSTYHTIAAQLRALALQLCSGRLVFLLEGGYDVEALGESVVETWLALLGEPSAEALRPAVVPQLEPLKEVQALIQQLRRIHRL